MAWPNRFQDIAIPFVCGVCGDQLMIHSQMDTGPIPYTGLEVAADQQYSHVVDGTPWCVEVRGWDG